MSDVRKLLETLKAELDFVNRGGYRKASWRPQFIFEDSPTCLIAVEVRSLAPNASWRHSCRSTRAGVRSPERPRRNG